MAPRTRPILKIIKKKKSKKAISAGYSVAVNNQENRDRYKHADQFDANQCNNPVTRKIVRESARAVTSNNCLAEGMIESYVTEVNSTGARLNLSSFKNKQAANKIEKLYHNWYKGIDGPEKLDLSLRAEIIDGESFELKTRKRFNAFSPVNVNWTPLECDRVTNPDLGMVLEDSEVDGIKYDLETHEPISYKFLKKHPGSANAWFMDKKEYDTHDAENVIHMFKRKRAEQIRGISEIHSALAIFSDLQGYSEAVLTCARTAAAHAVIYKLNTRLIDDDGEGLEAPSMGGASGHTIENGQAVFAPDGYEATQLKAEQPTTTYPSFVRAKMLEAGRCLGMPYNVAAGDSSDHNMASGKMDRLTFDTQIDKRRQKTGDHKLTRYFMSFITEALLIPGFLPPEAYMEDADFSHEWLWPSTKAVDPSKEAKAYETKLVMRGLSFAEYFAKKGKDWREAFDQMAEEEAYAAKIGLNLSGVIQSIVVAAGNGPPDKGKDRGNSDDDDDDDRKNK